MPDKSMQPAASAHELAFVFKTVRVTTGAVAAGAQAEVAVTWPTPFPSTAYSVVATVEEGTAANDTLRVLKVVSRTAAGCVVRVANAAAAGATGTLHVVGIPD